MSTRSGPSNPPSSLAVMVRRWWWLAALVVAAVAVALVGVAVLSPEPSNLDLKNEALAPCFEEPWSSSVDTRSGDCTDNDKYWKALTSDEREFVTSMQDGPLSGTGLEAVDILGEAQILCDETRDFGGDVALVENDQHQSAARSLGVRVDVARTFNAYARQYQCPELLTSGDRSVLSQGAYSSTTARPAPAPTESDAAPAEPSSTTDQKFLTEAGADGLTPADQEKYVTEANAVCQYRMHNRSNPEMTVYLTNALDLDPTTADDVRIAAIMAYCPNYLY